MYEEVATLCFFVTTVYWHTQYFLPFQESRKDLVVLNDPMFNMFPSLNMAYIINPIQYYSVHKFLYFLSFQPWSQICLAFQIYSCSLILRSLCMFVCPLRAHPSISPLRLPIEDFVFGKHDGSIRLHDLMFSGHVSMLTLMGLFTNNNIYYIMAGIVTLCMVISRVHYSIDCIVAFFAMYTLFDIFTYYH